ncbi:MAG: hypothetical protein ACRDIC_19630 [bacterium]
MSEIVPGAISAPTETAPAVAAVEYPSTWRAEDRGHWDGASDDVRKIIAARESGWAKERDQYKASHEAWSKHEPVYKRFEKLFQDEGIAPEVGVGNLLQLAHTLRYGDDTVREKVLGEMSRVYGPKSKPDYLDPAVADLQSGYDGKFSQMQQSIESMQGALREYLESDTRRLIDEFAKREDRKHFKDVSTVMGQLIKGGIASGLDDAYDMAVRLNPKLSAAPAPAAAAEIKGAQSRQALQAAGVNIRGNGKAPEGAKPQKGSLRKSLAKAYDSLSAKNN